MSLSLLSNVLVGIPKSKEKRSLLKQSNQNFLKLRFRADYCEEIILNVTNMMQ